MHDCFDALVNSYKDKTDQAADSFSSDQMQWVLLDHSITADIYSNLKLFKLNSTWVENAADRNV